MLEKISAVICLVAAGLIIPGCTSEKASLDPAVQTALAAMDREYDAMFTWWGTIYDSASGGFYYSQSSKNNPAYGPDIEATSKAVKVLSWMGVMDRTPEKVRQGIIRFFQARQDSASGFFYNPQHRQRYNARLRSRALGMASGDLKRLGAEPRYPLPRQKVADNEEARRHYAHLESPARLKAWLEKLPWHRTWSAGSRVLDQSGSFLEMTGPFREEMLDTMAAFISRRQGPDGWISAGEDWHSVLSGTYKIISFFDKNGRTMPRMKELTASVLDRLKNEKYNNLIVLYNTANIISILHRRGTGFTPEQQAAIINAFTAQLKKFHAPDHGFLTHSDKPAAVCNGILMADEMMEGNTNATGLALKARNKLYEMALGSENIPPHPRVGDFIRALRAFYQTGK